MLEPNPPEPCPICNNRSKDDCGTDRCSLVGVYLCHRGSKQPPTVRDLETVAQFREMLRERELAGLPILGVCNGPDPEPEPIRRETPDDPEPIRNPHIQMYPGDEWEPWVHPACER